MSDTAQIATSIIDVRPRAVGCGNCYFRKRQFVGGRGTFSSKMVMVGEGPGATEIAKRTPFIGLSGMLLEQCLPEGYTVDDFWVTNAMQCLPIKLANQTAKNTNNMKSACMRCSKRLLTEIEAHPREVILAMGNAALWSLTGDYSLKITQCRGQLYESPLAKRGIVAAVHPAFLLRGGSHVGKFKQDIAYAIDLAGGESLRQPIPHSWTLCNTPLEVYKVLWEFRRIRQQTQNNIIGADIETGGFNHREDEILCLGISLDSSKVYIIPEHLIGWTYELFKDEEFEWVWHNGKFDIKFFRYRNIQARVDHDTLLMNYAMNEVRGFHDLEQVAGDEIGAPDYKYMIKPYLPNRRTSYRNIPKPVLHKYASLDVTNTRQVFDVLYPRLLKDKASSYLYHTLLLPASNLLTIVEENGLRVDFERVNDNKKYYEAELAKQQVVIDDIAQSVGLSSLNPNSPKQVAHILYDKFKFRGRKRGTGKAILEKMPDHPLVAAILAHRKLAKGYGTYVKPLYRHVGSDGKVHSSFMLHGTPTGRLVSRDPNVQNIPRDPRLRGQFIASEGFIYVEVDLDQAELRSLAERSRDPELCRIYNTPGLSIHKEVSTSLWGDSWAERYAIEDPEDPIFIIAYEEYMRTKMLNFGIVYGREAPSIAADLGIPLVDAQDMIDGWSTKFPVAWEYIEKCRQAPLLGQNLITPFGRRKRHGVVSRERLKDLQNQASNFPHQSIASDITLRSAIIVQPHLIKYNIHIVNLIHDAILFEVPIIKTTIDYVIKYTGDVMIAVPIERGMTAVPFVSDAKVGYRWGSLHNYKMGDDKSW